MALAQVLSRACVGVEAPLITVEVHLAGGLPCVSIVGLPETAVREAKDRVRSALQNSGFEFPVSRVTISLAPAELPKEGGGFDLPIALGILAASGQIPAKSLSAYVFLGELSLSGSLRPVRGALPAALRSAASGLGLIVPLANAEETGLVRGCDCRCANSLLEVAAWLHGQQELPLATPAPERVRPAAPDLSDVVGQSAAVRALEVVAAGSHNLLMVGPPGTGKTMLASRLPGILPPMSEAEAIESAAITSISHSGFNVSRWSARPFRAPHHTASAVALVGGGSQPRPGEISLAHHGVLFLDELPEFSRHVLEVLREPLESGHILIARAARRAEFPARFQLVAAMNPCPCGHAGDPQRECRCTAEQVQRYLTRISGPLLDRIDVQVTVPRPNEPLLEPGKRGAASSAQVREHVVAAREVQLKRNGHANALLDRAGLERHCKLGASERELLEQAAQRLVLSPRALFRVLRVARTIADLEGHDAIDTTDLAEAISYRQR